MPCATTTSAPAASAATVSATVDTLANQAMPRDLSSATKSGGRAPVTNETTGGTASRSASHWATKSGGLASPAPGGTSGTHSPRKLATAASRATSLCGTGSGTPKTIWQGPLLSDAQWPIASGSISSAPQVPRPPAFATAADNAGGHAPAIGASPIGMRGPKRAQNDAIRSPRPIASAA